MNADKANNGVIVGEPMSTIPTSPSKPSSLSFSSTSRPSTPISTYTFPRPLSPSKSDALKANPHPYPIRTTSTAVLSRSNSTASTVSTAHPHQYQYQYYVPQSPSKESPPSEGKDTKRGGRHRYSKSLVNLDSGPKVLPSPSSTTTTTLFSHRNRSISSLSSSESSSPTKSEEEEEENDDDDDGEDLATGKKNKRGRRAAYRGGKVRGIIASFEGRGGPEDGNEQGSRDYYRRKRTESDASSVSSASSFGSFTDVKADDGDTSGGGNKLPLDRFDSTPKRNTENQGTHRGREEEEPTIEELLGSTACGDPTPDDGVVYDETVKLHSANVAYSTVTASSIRYSLPMPTFSSTARRNPKSAVLDRPSTDADDDELSVEELLALVSTNSGSGASAWERDGVGCCTVKRVGDVEGFVDVTIGRLEEKKLAQEGPSTSHPPVARQISPTGPGTTTKGEREHELVQEMSEAREMVRALSARVASVEAKIGEMEIVAGDLEVRGRQLLVDGDDDDEDSKPPPQGQSLHGRVASTLYRTVFGGVGVGVSLVKMVLPTSRSKPKIRSREPSPTRAVLPMWYKRSWACYLLFLGLGACAFVLREVVRRGMMLRGRRT